MSGPTLSPSQPTPAAAPAMTHDTVPKTAKLTLGDRELDLPVMVGSEGEVAIDIRQLRAKTGAITYDPGLGNTGACLSKITFLDGEQGILRYAGYPIEELAKSSHFVEVMWLLLHQQLQETVNQEVLHEVVIPLQTTMDGGNKDGLLEAAVSLTMAFQCQDLEDFTSKKI